MPAKFFAEPNPPASLLDEIESLCPTNPFLTAQYAASMRATGAQAWIAGLRDGGVITGCAAFLHSGRLDRNLEIPSLPDLACPEVFWRELLRHCRETGVTTLTVGSFASRTAAIPQLRGEIRRSQRWEFVLELADKDLLRGMHPEHRRRIRRAGEAGVEIRRASDEEACRQHGELIRASFHRRELRGETVPAGVHAELLKALMRHGAGEIYQAILGGQVVSSRLVIQARQGVYTHSSGNSPEGMACGASHLLNYEIAKVAQSKSMRTCIFGGVDRLESGLAEFKSRFGTTVVPLETAEFYLGGRMRRKLTTALRLLTTDRAALAAIFRVRISRWVVYSVEPVHIQPAVMPDGVVFRKLEEHELRTAPPSWELRQEQIDRFHRLGVNEAYAIFHQGRFAHVSWLLTRSMEGKPPLVNLREDEAEITACVTLPAFRGMGLYPLAIRSLCEIARGQGISRVYMKARPENTPSLRGIEKAGLVRHGSIAHVILPLVSSDGLVFRGHRLSWPKA